MNARLTALAAAVPLAIGLVADVATTPQPAPQETVVAATGAAMVMRHAVLWSAPPPNAERLGTVEAGEIVWLMPPGSQSGYAHVQTQSEQVAWVTIRRLRAIDESEVHQPGPAPAEPTPVATLHVAAGDFDGCPVEGNPSPKGTRYQEILSLNREKNRSATPTDTDIDRDVTLAELLEPSDDSQRWSTSRAAEIVGYVFHVKPGGKETVNCKNPDKRDFDSHIELTLGPDDSGPTRRVIVEVTPRWRAAAAVVGVDWSTQSLQETIEGRCVQVRGWLFLDAEHVAQAENTRPGGPHNWRATAWEIHPVTNLQVVECPAGIGG